MLDEARADRRELDTIAVRQAMHKAKREKEEQLRMRNKQITERLRYACNVWEGRIGMADSGS